MRTCVCAYVRTCVRACVRVCVCVCVPACLCVLHDTIGRRWKTCWWTRSFSRFCRLCTICFFDWYCNHGSVHCTVRIFLKHLTHLHFCIEPSAVADVNALGCTSGHRAKWKQEIVGVPARPLARFEHLLSSDESIMSRYRAKVRARR